MVMKSRVDVDSTTVTSTIVKWEYKRTRKNKVSEIVIDFSSDILSSVTLEVGKTLEVWRGWTAVDDEKIFDGFVSKFEIMGNQVRVTGKDKMWDLVRKSVNKVYDEDVDASAGKVSEIFDDLVTTFGGLSTTASTIQDSGTVLTLKKFFCRQTDVFERCQALADVLDWQFYYKASDDKMYFEPKGYTTSTVTLTVGSNVLNVPKWNKDTSKMVNKITIFGANALVDAKETDTGDGTTKIFTLTNTPVNMIQVTDAGARQVGGISGSSTGQDYNVDPQKKEIQFLTAPANTNALVFDYQYNVPTPVSRRVQASIDAYGTFETQLTLTDVQDVTDAEARTTEILNRFSEPFLSSKLLVKNETAADVVNPGETVTVVDNVNSPVVNQSFIVEKVIVRFPNRFDEVFVGEQSLEVGDVLYGMANKIKRLEELSTKDQDLLTQVEDITSDVILENRYLMAKRNYIKESFILDHAENSLLDRGQTLDDFNTTGNWATAGDFTVTLGAEATHVWVNTNSVKLTWAATSGEAAIEDATTSQGDLSDFTGVSSGTPSKGTCGIWMYMTDSTIVSDFKLRIGSSSSDYKEYNGTEADWGSTFRNGWNYFVFDLDSPDGTAGTVDWTAIDYSRIAWTVTGAESTGMWVEYYTISKSDSIGQNGIGIRSVEDAEPDITRIIQQGLKYRELFLDTDFKDATNTTATWNTTTGKVNYSGAQVGQSTIIASNGVNITKATLTATNDNGLLTYELSPDGGTTWETVTSGIQHTFATAGQKLKWRITSSGTDNLNSLVISYVE